MESFRISAAIWDFWLWKLILVVEMLRTRTTESVVLRQNKRPQWDTACLRVLANFTAKLFFRPNRLNLDNSSERGVFFSLALFHEGDQTENQNLSFPRESQWTQWDTQCDIKCPKKCGSPEFEIVNADSGSLSLSITRNNGWIQNFRKFSIISEFGLRSTQCVVEF